MTTAQTPDHLVHELLPAAGRDLHAALRDGTYIDGMERTLAGMAVTGYLDGWGEHREAMARDTAERLLRDLLETWVAGLNFLDGEDDRTEAAIATATNVLLLGDTLWTAEEQLVRLATAAVVEEEHLICQLSKIEKEG